MTPPSRSASAVLAAMAVVASGCTTSVLHESAHEDQLLRTLARLGRVGSASICDPAVIAKTFGITIGPFKRTSTDSILGNPKIDQDFAVVAQQESGVLSGSYTRFRSSQLSTCRLELRFKSPRLCGATDEHAAAVMGVPLSYGPAPLHGDPTPSYVYYAYPNPEAAHTSIFIGTVGQRCTERLGILSKGEWR